MKKMIFCCIIVLFLFSIVVIAAEDCPVLLDKAEVTAATDLSNCGDSMPKGKKVTISGKGYIRINNAIYSGNAKCTFDNNGKISCTGKNLNIDYEGRSTNIQNAEITVNPDGTITGECLAATCTVGKAKFKKGNKFSYNGKNQEIKIKAGDANFKGQDLKGFTITIDPDNGKRPTVILPNGASKLMEGSAKIIENHIYNIKKGSRLFVECGTKDECWESVKNTNNNYNHIYYSTSANKNSIANDIAKYCKPGIDKGEVNNCYVSFDRGTEPNNIQLWGKGFNVQFNDDPRKVVRVISKKGIIVLEAHQKATPPVSSKIYIKNGVAKGIGSKNKYTLITYKPEETGGGGWEIIKTESGEKVYTTTQNIDTSIQDDSPSLASTQVGEPKTVATTGNRLLCEENAGAFGGDDVCDTLAGHYAVNVVNNYDTKYIGGDSEPTNNNWYYNAPLGDQGVVVVMAPFAEDRTKVVGYLPVGWESNFEECQDNMKTDECWNAVQPYLITNTPSFNDQMLNRILFKNIDKGDSS